MTLLWLHPIGVGSEKGCDIIKLICYLTPLRIKPLPRNKISVNRGHFCSTNADDGGKASTQKADKQRELGRKNIICKLVSFQFLPFHVMGFSLPTCSLRIWCLRTWSIKNLQEKLFFKMVHIY